MSFRSILINVIFGQEKSAIKRLKQFIEFLFLKSINYLRIFYLFCLSLSVSFCLRVILSLSLSLSPSLSLSLSLALCLSLSHTHTHARTHTHTVTCMMKLFLRQAHSYGQFHNILIITWYTGSLSVKKKLIQIYIIAPI